MPKRSLTSPTAMALKDFAKLRLRGAESRRRHRRPDGKRAEGEHKYLSIRGIDRELGIHIDTVKNYLSAESPPMAQSRVSSKYRILVE